MQGFTASFVIYKIHDIFLFTVSQVNTQFIQPSDSLQYHGITSDLDQGRPVKWETFSKTEKHSTKMRELPFLLQHKICLMLDVERTDGQDVREFADKLGITVSEFCLLRQKAFILQTTTTSVVLKERFTGTVGDFVALMEKMERDDVISAIDD